MISGKLIQNLNNSDLINFINLLYQTDNTKMANIAITRYISMGSMDTKEYLDLAYLQLLNSKKNDMYNTLSTCINKLGNKATEAISRDNRFKIIHNELRYKKLIKTYLNKPVYSF